MRAIFRAARTIPRRKNPGNNTTRFSAPAVAAAALFTISAPIPTAVAEPAALREARPALSDTAPKKSETPETTDPTDTIPLRDNTSLTLLLRQQYDFAADLEDDGDVSIYRAEAGLTLTHRPSPAWSISATLVTEWSSYDFSNSAAIAPGVTGDPFDEFFEASTFLRATRFFENNYALTLGAFAGANFEQGAKLSDSIVGGGLAALGYRFSDRLFISAGAAVQSRLEDDASITPFLSLRWDITDTVSLESEGLGLKLRSQLNDHWTVGMIGQYQRREYRLDDGHPIAALDEGVLRDARVELALLAEWRASSRFSAEGRLGVTPWQEYEILDDSGHRVTEFDTDPSIFVWLGITVGF
ncbi:MAG: DUF6268 family outer membrane beta-barrel protein [Phycisphaerales bacterium]